MILKKSEDKFVDYKLLSNKLDNSRLNDIIYHFGINKEGKLIDVDYIQKWYFSFVRDKSIFELAKLILEVPCDIKR